LFTSGVEVYQWRDGHSPIGKLLMLPRVLGKDTRKGGIEDKKRRARSRERQTSEKGKT
jgi:hypothetical protein